jgi:hypothetical protein
MPAWLNAPEPLGVVIAERLLLVPLPNSALARTAITNLT